MFIRFLLIFDMFNGLTSSLLKGLAYSVALHDQEMHLKAIARHTSRILVLYQPVDYSLFRKPSLSERMTEQAYTLLRRGIPERYLEEGREAVMCLGRQPRRMFDRS